MTKLTDVLEYIDSCSDKQWLKFCECMENRGYIIEGKYLHDYDYPHVIRCKDCRHCNRELALGKWEGSCKYWNTHSVMLNDFCSRAKRKNDEI